MGLCQGRGYNGLRCSPPNTRYLRRHRNGRGSWSHATHHVLGIGTGQQRPLRWTVYWLPVIMSQQPRQLLGISRGDTRSRISASQERGSIILDIGRVYTKWVGLSLLPGYFDPENFGPPNQNFQGKNGPLEDKIYGGKWWRGTTCTHLGVTIIIIH